MSSYCFIWLPITVVCTMYVSCVFFHTLRFLPHLFFNSLLSLCFFDLIIRFYYRTTCRTTCSHFRFTTQTLTTSVFLTSTRSTSIRSTWYYYDRHCPPPLCQKLPTRLPKQFNDELHQGENDLGSWLPIFDSDTPCYGGFLVISQKLHSQRLEDGAHVAQTDRRLFLQWLRGHCIECGIVWQVNQYPFTRDHSVLFSFLWSVVGQLFTQRCDLQIS